mgnify:CR=1 FL=1
MVYLVFSFNGYQDVAEIDSPLILKEETVAKLIARWNLIKDKKLNPEGIEPPQAPAAAGWQTDRRYGVRTRGG